MAKAIGDWRTNLANERETLTHQRASKSHHARKGPVTSLEPKDNLSTSSAKVKSADERKPLTRRRAPNYPRITQGQGRGPVFNITRGQGQGRGHEGTQGQGRGHSTHTGKGAGPYTISQDVIERAMADVHRQLLAEYNEYNTQQTLQLHSPNVPHSHTAAANPCSTETGPQPQEQLDGWKPT